MGETAKVHIECDNSACEKDVESIRLALKRKHWAKDKKEYDTSDEASIVEYEIKEPLLKQERKSFELEL